MKIAVKKDSNTGIFKFIRHEKIDGKMFEVEAMIDLSGRLIQREQSPKNLKMTSENNSDYVIWNDSYYHYIFDIDFSLKEIYTYINEFIKYITDRDRIKSYIIRYNDELKKKQSKKSESGNKTEA